MLRRAANLRGQRSCSYRAAWQAAINHALDRVRVMLGARFRGSVANQGIWRLTASRPKPTVCLRPDSGSNALIICRLAFRGLVPSLWGTQTNDQRRRPKNPYFRLYRSSRFKKASSPPSRIRRTALFVTSASKLPEEYFSTPLMLSATTTCSASAFTTRFAL